MTRRGLFAGIAAAVAAVKAPKSEPVGPDEETKKKYPVILGSYHSCPFVGFKFSPLARYVEQKQK